MDSYQQKRYEQDRQAGTRLCAGFALAAAVLWPVSYLISGHGTATDPNWWSVTTAVSWIAAVVCSVGFGISAAILQFIVLPVEGSNR